MTRTLLAAIMIAGAVGAAPGLALSEARATDAGAGTPQFRVDCWIGMKFGDRPSQLIRGWICEPPYRPAVEAPARSATAGEESAFAGKDDVAAVGSGRTPR